MRNVQNVFNSLEAYCQQNGIEDLLKEWDKEKNALSPREIGYKSSKKVWWKCECEHSYDMSINDRTSRQRGCPYCAGRKALKGFNDIGTTNPELLDDWDYDKNSFAPYEVMAGSDKYVWWKCKLGHEWRTRVHNRALRHAGCPFCTNQKVLYGFNDLETWCLKNNRKDILKEWNTEKNDTIPKSVFPKTSKKAWWKCSKGHEWQATIGSRTSGTGCPYCCSEPKKVMRGFNDLYSWCKKNQKEYILNEWDYNKNSVTPDSVTPRSGKKVWWICSKHHQWITGINNRTRLNGSGCPICTRGQTSYPEQAVAFYLGKVFSIIQRYRIKGYEVDVYIPDHKIGVEYDGRHFHEGKKAAIAEKKKDVALASESIQLIRIKETKNRREINDRVISFPANAGNYKTDDFEWAIQMMIEVIGSIIHKQITLSVNIERDDMMIREHYMNTLRVNSVAALYPELMDEWDILKNNGIGADAYSAHNGLKVWWKCKYGHSWQASINSRTRFKLGCPYCAGQKVTEGKNDLVTWSRENNPSILDEWDYEKNDRNPQEYAKTSNKKVWWRCNNGHEWQAAISNRVHGTGCPVCKKAQTSRRGNTSLQEWCESNNNAKILNEWNYGKNEGKKPSDYSHGSHISVWWKCDKGHEWQAQIKSRTYNHGCPYCSPTFKRVTKGVNDLITWCKENKKEFLIEEWDYTKNTCNPDSVSKGSHKRAFWKCKQGHEWQAVIKERTKTNGNMCPICKGN